MSTRITQRGTSLAGSLAVLNAEQYRIELRTVIVCFFVRTDGLVNGKMCNVAHINISSNLLLLLVKLLTDNKLWMLLLDISREILDCRGADR